MTRIAQHQSINKSILYQPTVFKFLGALNGVSVSMGALGSGKVTLRKNTHKVKKTFIVMLKSTHKSQ